jgi:hypothetical protein
MKPLSYLLIHYKRDESYNVVFLIHYNVRRIFLFDTIYILLLETNYSVKVPSMIKIYHLHVN